MYHFPATEFLPLEEDLARFLDDLAVHTARERLITPTTHLASFLDAPMDATTSPLHHVDHVAVYAGDYKCEEDFELWFECLQRLNVFSDVSMGPSHIAARTYGTQGYWVSADFCGGGIEIFVLKNDGSWRSFPMQKKVSRMSHIALAVDSSCDVLPILNDLSKYPGIAILSYSPVDELNHTYGHLLNVNTDAVLEIVNRRGQV